MDTMHLPLHLEKNHQKSSTNPNGSMLLFTMMRELNFSGGPTQRRPAAPGHPGSGSAEQGYAVVCAAAGMRNHLGAHLMVPP
jgi:hypothetical protein